MAKMLVVRKPDRTIHQITLANKAVLMGVSNHLPLAQQYKFEEIDEEELKKLKLPYLDANYVSGADARDKIKEKDKELADKDKLIKQMEEKLAAMTGAGTGLPPMGTQPLSEGKAAKGQK